LIAADRNAITSQIVNNSAATTAGILQADGIDPGYYRRCEITDRNWVVVVGGSGQSKQLTLEANRELPVA
jgi:hypothetical protein